MTSTRVPSVSAAASKSLSLPLTETEKNIFDIISNSLKASQSSTVARVAGGWVRDKLLHRDSDDIDIALDDVSGLDFANNVNAYLTSIGHKTKTVAVIQANPEQSKHLETATLTINDMVIDCVNLRTETYTEHSRIPTIQFGTPVEDALRRDFTVNALFYNLATQQVEDFTGQGIADLQHGVIRTPLPPLETFSDDPLRVLRAIRFASRYNFALADDLVLAAGDKKIHDAMTNGKISRERVLKELQGMFNSKGHPFLALLLIYRLNLLDTLLLVNERREAPLFDPDVVNQEAEQKLFAHCQGDLTSALSLWQQISMETVAWTSVLLAIQSHWKISSTEELTSIMSAASVHPSTVNSESLLSIEGGEITSRLYHTAICAGLKSYMTFNKKKKKVSFISTLLRESLKLEEKMIRHVQTMMEVMPIIASYAKVHTTAEALQQSPEHPTYQQQREQAGLLIRHCKEKWTEALLLSCAYEITAESLRWRPEASPLLDHSTYVADLNSIRDKLRVTDVTISPWAMEIIQRYRVLYWRWETQLRLDTAFDLKPLLSGNDIMSAFPSAKGPQLGKIMEEQTKWQFRHEHGTKEELVKFIASIL